MYRLEIHTYMSDVRKTHSLGSAHGMITLCSNRSYFRLHLLHIDRRGSLVVGFVGGFPGGVRGIFSLIEVLFDFLMASQLLFSPTLR